MLFPGRKPSACLQVLHAPWFVSHCSGQWPWIDCLSRPMLYRCLSQDALGGNSRTAMVVTVCPTTLNVDETLFALQFATRARNVSLGPAQRNVTAKNLLEELKELRARLREAARKKVIGCLTSSRLPRTLTASHPYGLRGWSHA